MIKPLKDAEINSSSRAQVEKINELVAEVTFLRKIVARLAAGSIISMSERDKLHDG